MKDTTTIKDLLNSFEINEEIDYNIWLLNNFNKYQANAWHDANFSPETAKSWRQAGWAHNQASIAKGWLHEGISQQQAYDWNDEGFTPLEARKWLRAGINDPKEALVYKEEKRLPSTFTKTIKTVEEHLDQWNAYDRDEEMRDWVDAGMNRNIEEWKLTGMEPVMASRWKVHNFLPEEAISWGKRFYPESAFVWKRAGFNLEESIRWDSVGFAPTDAQEWKQAGFTAERAKRHWDDGTFSPNDVNESIKFVPPYTVDVWEERDRLSIVVSDANDETVSEWWDDDARQMFEDGYFISGNGLKQSVLNYLKDMKVI